MFFMKTKKRVKKLEENYEKLISEQEATLDKLVSLENAIISIKRKSDAFTEFGENKNTIDFKSESKNIVMTLKTYIDEQIEKSEKSNVSINDVSKMIRQSESQIINQMNSLVEHSSAQPTVNDDYNKINQQMAAIMQQVNNSNQRIEQLYNLLNNEIIRNNQLVNSIGLIQQHINELEQSSSSVSQSAISPSVFPITSDSSVNEKERATAVKVDIIPAKPKSVNTAPIFTDNSALNIKMINAILKNALTLQEKYAKVLPRSDENSIYFKTVDSCVNKLQKLADKVVSTDMESSKIAVELVKILNLTVVKNFVNKSLLSVIDEFLLDCKFIKKELDIGKKLSDEDYDYIGEMPLEVPVSSSEKHNVIVRKKHDAYVIYYKDDEGISNCIICGEYSIGKYSK